MQATLATAAVRIRTAAEKQAERLKAAVEKLEARWGKDAPLFAGGIRYDERGVDDMGGYGDIEEDMRRDFVKQDEEGWRRP